MSPRSRLVYSTDEPAGGKRRGSAAAQPGPAKPRADAAGPEAGLKPGTVYVERSRKGRRGKTVTLVLNLPGTEDEKARLLKELKTLCGAGGAIKAGVLEIQGDHRDKLMAFLQDRGHAVKPRGG